MNMVKEDRTKYPKCATLLMGLGTSLKARPKVLNTFLDICKADEQYKSTARQVEAIARRALQWGTPPNIVVAKGLVKGIVRGQSFEGCGWNNGFGQAFGRAVFIEATSIWFDAFE